MRILFQTYSLAFQAPGGGERVMIELRKSLSALGHQVDMYSPWIHNPVDYDLVHYFSILENDSWQYLNRNFSKKPLFVTPTMFLDRTVKTRLTFQKEKFFSRWNRLNRKNSYLNMQIPTHFLPTTAYESQNLKKYFDIPESKISVLPNGVAKQFYEGNHREFRDFTKIEVPYVLHVGRFHPVKQQEVIIRALMNTEITCVFIGGQDKSHPEYLGQCQSLAEKSSTNNFHFIPFLDGEDPLLASAYAGASLFVFPSLFETFGLAPLEAAIAGCPLLLSDGMTDKLLFRDTAVFLPSRAVSQWRAEILMRMNKPERISAEHRIKLRDDHDWGKIARDLESLYKKYI